MAILEPFFPWIAIAATVSVFVGLQARRGVPTDLLFILGAAFVTAIGFVIIVAAMNGGEQAVPAGGWEWECVCGRSGGLSGVGV